MDKERWKQIDELVAEALEISEAEREKFVSEKCLDDDDLRKQVLALLEAGKETDNFMATPAIDFVAKKIADESTTVFDNQLSGKRLGVYKIEGFLGAGGMGEIYLAHDEKLNRKVALKVLPKEFLANEERVRRFKTEAKAIAALNHPNIVTIYDFGKIDETNFIATEYVEGKTVRELIKEDKTLKEKLSIILQILDALSSAHKAGIIHRDIKPANIMVRHDGYVKILDFGLVKLTEDNMNESGTFSRTMKGAVIGTPAYMSPSQATGEKIDHRTDLWSLALVFYEMLTKKNPFKKENQKATIRAILSNDAPPLNSIDSNIPPEIERILDKALEKDPDLGYQTASDFMADLKRVKRVIDSSPSWSPYLISKEKDKTANSKGYIPYLISGVAILFLGIGIWYFAFQSQKNNLVEWEKAKVIQLTEQLGKEHFPSLSPDGNTFVYASDENGNFDIYSRRVGSKKSINLTSNSESQDNQPSISPNGNLIAFRSNRKPSGIYIMEITGENPRQITDFGYHPSWSPDGKKLAISERTLERPTRRGKSSIWIIDIESGNKRKLIGNYANQPTWSPNGKRIAFWQIRSGGRTDVATISVEGGDHRFVTKSASTNWNPVWSPDGKHLYYSSDKSGNMAFWRIQIDSETGETLGEAKLVPTPAKFNSHLSFSKDGKKLIYVQTNIQGNIKSIEFDDKTGTTIGEPFAVTSGDYEFSRPVLSADNEKFVVLQKRLTQDDIVVIDRNGKNRLDLTNDKHFDRYPRWSPNGNRIAMTSDRAGKYDIWLMQNDGTSLQQVTFNANSSFPVWSPDNKQLAYSVASQTYIIDLDKDLQQQTPKSLPNVNEKRTFVTWDWSNDGKKLAGLYRADENWSGVGFYSFETNKFEKVIKAVAFPYWLPNNRQILFSKGNKIFLVDIISKEKKEIFSSPQKNIKEASISPDGKFISFIEYVTESNIWLLDSSQNK